MQKRIINRENGRGRQPTKNTGQKGKQTFASIFYLESELNSPGKRQKATGIHHETRE